MRVCIFVADLGDISQRKAALLAEVRTLLGPATITEISFVGFRQSRPVDDVTRAFQPSVTDHYTRTRLANAALRLVDANLIPVAAARAVLALCAPAFVEAILACEPDLVLLDVRWGRYLASLLEPEFPRRV